MTETKKIKRNIWKRAGKFIFRLALYIVLFLLFISAGIYISLQFDSVQNKVKSIALNEVNKILIADIEVDRLDFKLFGIVRLYGVRMMTAGDTLASIDRIYINPDYWKLLDGKIIIRKLVLDSPNIKLLRNATDSLWNYNLIAMPVEDKDDLKEPGELVIQIGNLTINNGRFFMIDSLAERMPAGMFDPSKMMFDDINLSLGAKSRPLDAEFTLDVKRLSVTDINSGLALNHFHGKLHLDDEGVTAKKTYIDMANSKIDLNASMTNINLFEGGDIEDAVFDIDIKDSEVNFDNLSYFADVPLTINGINEVDLKASGKLGDLYLENLNLVNGDLQLIVTAKADKILDPELFAFNAKLDGSSVPQKELRRILPDVDLSAVPNLGNFKFNNFFVQGKSDSVWVDMDIMAGNVNLKGGAGAGSFDTKLGYSCDLRFTNLDLYLFTQEPELRSNINGTLVARGQGVDTDDIFINAQLNTSKTKISDYDFNSFTADFEVSDSLSIRINEITAIIDNKILTAEIEDEYDEDYPRTSKISLSGLLDFADFDLPRYDIKIDMEDINFVNLLDNNALPRNFSSSLQLQGSGFHPDSLEAKLISSIDELTFEDRSMLPFNFNFELNKFGDNIRSLSITSPLIKVDLEGRFLFTDLIESLSNQGTYFAEFLSRKLDGLLAATTQETDTPTEIELMESESFLTAFPDIDITLSAEIKDFYFLNFFAEDFELISDLDLYLTLFSEDYESRLKIDSINIGITNLSIGENIISSSPLQLNGDLRMIIVDSQPTFDHFDLELDKAAVIKYLKRNEENEAEEVLKLSDFRFKVDYDGSSLLVKTLGKVNDYAQIQVGSKLNINKNMLNLQIDDLSIAINEQFTWSNIQPILIDANPESLFIKSFELSRENQEMIAFTGGISNNKFTDVKLVLRDLPLEEFVFFAGSELRNSLSPFSGKLDSLTLEIEGSISDPVMSINSDFSELVYGKYQFGFFNTEMSWQKNNAKGTARLYAPSGNSFQNYLNVNIRSFPLDIGMIPDSLKPKSAPIDVVISTKDFPLQLVSPFVPGISNIVGTMDAELNLTGEDFDGIALQGDATILKTKFLLDATNSEYIVDTGVKFTKDKIEIPEIYLRNAGRESQIGRAQGKGELVLKDFNVESFDFEFKADRLRVMSSATQQSMPWLYGDLIVSNDARPIRFYGSFDAPSLSGDINIIRADLFMPQIQSQTTARSIMNYEILDESIRVTFVETDSGYVVQNNVEPVAQEEQNFADLINYDISMKILGQLAVTMDIGALGEMYAIIGTPDRNVPIRYKKVRWEKDAEFIGELEVKDGSVFRSFRLLQTRGNIYFSTGSIEEPNLDLRAEYNGTAYREGLPRPFTVTMIITGTPQIPMVEFAYSIDGVEAVGDKKRIEQDAIMLIVTGSIGGANGGGDAPNLQQMQMAAGSGVVSQYGSQLLTSFLTTTGFIQSANIDFKSDNIDETTVKLSGQIFGNITWTVGGSVSDISGNNQIIVDVPLSNFFENEIFRNFIFQFSKDMYSNTTTSNQYRDSKYWEFKFKFGGSY